MNNIGKSGAIITIIGGSIMALVGLLMLVGTTAVGAVAKQNSSVLSILSLLTFGLGIANIILSAVCLKSKKDSTRVAAGIIAIVSLFFAWIAFFFTAIVVLVGGILLLCGKSQVKLNEIEEYTNSNNASVSEMFSNKESNLNNNEIE